MHIFFVNWFEIFHTIAVLPDSVAVVCRSVFVLLFTDTATLFANLIARTAQDIDILIDSLPSEELTPEKQVDTLRKLELENQQSAERLSRAVKDGGI